MIKKTFKDNVRLQEFSLARLIPNIVTIGALCSGLSAIRFAMLERFDVAVIAILVAAFLDGLDGRLARLLKATSEFGAEMDSLSDFISFGVSPAVVLYMLSLNKWGGLGWSVSLFFAVCMAFRLARFNVMNIVHKDETATNGKPSPYFLGMPAPAGALTALLPLILNIALEDQFFIHPSICACLLIFAGLIMISRLPTFSFKSMTIRRQWALPILVTAAIFITALINSPWETLSIIIILYLLTIPISIFRSYRAD